jgi:hypothetical protein
MDLSEAKEERRITVSGLFLLFLLLLLFLLNENGQFNFVPV